MVTILVTGAGGGVGQGIIKSLRMIDDIKIRVITADASNKATGLYAGDAAYLVASCASIDYMDTLENIFLYEKVDYYFPGTDVELEFCALNKKYIEEKYSVKTVISPLDAIRISDDKYKTYEFLRRNNFPCPWTYWANRADLDNLDYPVIIKPAVGCRSIGVYKVNSKAEILPKISSGKDLIVQELLGDDDSEFTCTIVKVGEVMSPVLVLKRVLRSGDTFRAEPIRHEVIESYVRDVALALNVHGSCNFQLRLGKANIPMLFEINCRFSGTTPFCAQLGFNPVEFYLKCVLDMEYKYDIDYDSIVLRYWSEVLIKKEMLKTVENRGRINPTIVTKPGLFS